MYQNTDMDWDHMDLKAVLEHTKHRYTRITDNMYGNGKWMVFNKVFISSKKTSGEIK
jgi:hypothetical protein